VRVLELGQVQGLELGQVLVLELGQVLAQELGQEQGLEREQGLGPHKQVDSQLITVPAGLIKFSFSSEKLLLRFYNLSVRKYFVLKAITSFIYSLQIKKGY